jgi:hypothetical protein
VKEHQSPGKKEIIGAGNVLGLISEKHPIDFDGGTYNWLINQICLQLTDIYLLGINHLTGSVGPKSHSSVEAAMRTHKSRMIYLDALSGCISGIQRNHVPLPVIAKVAKYLEGDDNIYFKPYEEQTRESLMQKLLS